MLRIEMLTKKTKKSPSQKYLIDPFDNLINTPNFRDIRNRFFIFQGSTGLGKTHATINHFIPTLFKKFRESSNNQYGNLFIYSVPQNCVRQDDEFKKAGLKHNFIVVQDDFDEAKRYLDDGIDVVLINTHHKLTGKDGKNFINWVTENLDPATVAIGLDEVHTWTGEKDNYADITGTNNPTYKAVLIDTLPKLALHTPYVFGLTATPHGEMTGHLETKSGMSYEIVNESPDKSDLTKYQGWYSNIHLFPYEKSEIVLDEAINKFLIRDNLYIKPVMMIQTRREIKNNKQQKNMDLKTTLSFLKEKLKSYPNKIQESDYSIVVLTDKQKYLMNLRGETKKVKESVAFQHLRDKNHPARFLIVIEKGGIGINVPNIKVLFSLRNSNKKNTKGEPLTMTILQLFGRAIRMAINVFIEIWNVKNDSMLSDVEKNMRIEELIEANSYEVYAVDTETHRVAKKIYEERIANSVTDGRTLLAQEGLLPMNPTLLTP
jgi:superfamily II DNA or RNA helicase